MALACVSHDEVDRIMKAHCIVAAIGDYNRCKLSTPMSPKCIDESSLLPTGFCALWWSAICRMIRAKLALGIVTFDLGEDE